jgi:hypothetical protein
MRQAKAVADPGSNRVANDRSAVAHFSSSWSFLLDFLGSASDSDVPLHGPIVRGRAPEILTESRGIAEEFIP